MKKVKIQLRVGVTMRTFLLFPSAESLYVWMTDMGPLGAIEGLDRVLLNAPDEFIEAEWSGCEFVEGACLSFIRLMKAVPSQNASGHVVSLHYGWCTRDMLPFTDDVLPDVKVKRLSPDDKQFDMSKAFKD